ncbi:alpha/beta hydrolase [Paenibacillus harenae]|uniref:alpha/beta hydrolase n=1 Tax=Paenibacillus harenae TaxID=306543 RepID=UPI002793C202|nr:alpha/beta hydrolase-fold protein [Paenibacillus harenae]MDQ0062524.1 enterochelin esterase-like enzyme [Paenibacillus harenae]
MKHLVKAIVLVAIYLLFLTSCSGSSVPQTENDESGNDPTVEAVARTPEPPVSSSKVEQIQIDSQALGKEMHATVYLPPDYSPDFRYPVLYLFHGYGGSHGDYFTYLHLDAVADRLLQEGLIHPLIMVAPEYRNSFGVNSKPGEGNDPGSVSIGPYEDYLIQEIIPFIDTHYSTQASKAGRYIGGISMGGYASLYLGLTHHELFSKIGAHSAALWTYTSSDLFTDQRDWLYSDERLRSLRDPFILAAPENLKEMKIYLDAGKGDALAEKDYEFYTLLKNNNAVVTWATAPGGHDAAYWTGQLEAYLGFYAGISRK